jgi:hypothetical protein
MIPEPNYSLQRRGIICKRPIQCLASSEILTPPPHCPASVYPDAFGAGGGHTRWGSIVRKTPDTALYSIYVSTLWFTAIRQLSIKTTLQKPITPYLRKGGKRRRCYTTKHAYKNSLELMKERVRLLKADMLAYILSYDSL